VTERKPPAASMPDWIEAQIRRAQDEGQFDNLAGAGKPLRLTDSHDPDWWVKEFVRRENIDTEALLPPGILLRKEKRRVGETVREMRTEAEVRRYLEDLNRRILVNIRDSTGPVIPVGKVDEEEVLRQWREHRQPPSPRPRIEPAQPAPRPKKSFWRRLFG
jgi:hypothetical protein